MARRNEPEPPLRNFSWLVEGEVAGCAYPQEGDALAELRRHGVRTIVNLHQKAHAEAEMRAYGLEEVHLPVTDFTAPTVDQLQVGVAAIERSIAAGRPAAVHCAAGLGRTGTLLAALLVHRGQTSAEAIARVRELRPGSLETPEQVAAVEAYARSAGERPAG